MIASGAQREGSRDDAPGRGRGGAPRRIALLVGLGLAWSAAAVASDLDLAEAEKLYRTGQSDEGAKRGRAEIGKGVWSEPCAHWEIKAELARGKAAAGFGT